MPSYTAVNNNMPIVLPPPAIVGNAKASDEWFRTLPPAGRQSYMNFITTTINNLTPAKKRRFNEILAKDGMSIEMLKTGFPGLHGGAPGLGWAQLLNIGSTLYLADQAQDAAADQSAASLAAQERLGRQQTESSERMNQALIDAQTEAAQLAAGSANKASELQAYTQVLALQMQAKQKEQRAEMFGPVWKNVITYGGLGLLVIGGGATFMILRRRKKRRK